ncbi:MAG: cytidine deaminase [Cucumibacter sp.]
MDAMLEALFEAARKARANAHVPYSHFPVGVAILADDGNIYAGCNVENAAYPVGACAEASAISAMVTAGGKRITTILVIGTGREPVTPCGGCRQRIREFAGPETRIVCTGDATDRTVTYTTDELLPDSFGPHNLDAVR